MGKGDATRDEVVEPDPFEAMGREIASVLRATHESASRLQAEAEQRAEARLAEAEAEVATRLADAERRAAESTRRLEQAADLLRQAEEARDRTRIEATNLLRGVLALLDMADARSSQLVDDLQGSRSELAVVRQGLVDFGAALPEPGPVATPEPPAPHDDQPPPVIDLREESDPTPEPAATETVRQPAGDEDRTTADQAMDDRVAASVRSAVSRAIDQCLTDPVPPPPAPHPG